MKLNKRIFISVLWIIIGVALVGCSLFDLLDTFWSGMGSALLLIGILQMVRLLRYSKNEEYRTNVNIEANDERNRFISTKAWSWAGYLFVLLAAIATIVFKLLGMDDYMMLSSGSVCIITLLYWICNLILRKKY